MTNPTTIDGARCIYNANAELLQRRLDTIYYYSGNNYRHEKIGEEHFAISIGGRVVLIAELIQAALFPNLDLWRITEATGPSTRHLVWR